MSGKLLSIVIVSYNTREILKSCLESLKEGVTELEGDWEVIIVDNGSTDGSVRYLKSQNLKLRLILNKKNLGFAKAVNQGIKKAAGKNLLLLNSDIICKKSAITKLVKFAEKKESLGLVGGGLVNPDGSSQASVSNLPSLVGAVREFWFGQRGRFEKYLPKTKKTIKVEGVVGAVMLIPDKTIKEVGLFDERYFMYFEDLDFCRRLKNRGLKVYYHPSARFIHYHGQSGQKNPEKVASYLVSSSKIYHGRFRYYLVTLVIWVGQKWQKTLRRN